MKNLDSGKSLPCLHRAARFESGRMETRRCKLPSRGGLSTKLVRRQSDRDDGEQAVHWLLSDHERASAQRKTVARTRLKKPAIVHVSE
jgi:hypothetical protein